MSEEQTLEVNKAQDTAPVQEDAKNNPTQGTESQPVYTKEQFESLNYSEMSLSQACLI